MGLSDGGSARQEALEVVFATLDRLGVRWCVLHNYDRLPVQIESVVDVAVAGGSRGVLAALAAALPPDGPQLINVFYEPGVNRYAIFATRRSSGREYLHLDLHDRCRFRGVTVLEAEAALRGRVHIDGMWGASPSAELTYSLAKRLLGRGPKMADLERWRVLVARDPSQCRQALQSLFGREADVVDAAIRGCDLARLRETRSALSRGFLPGSHRPMVIWGNLLRWMNRLVSPNGLIVGLSAEDPGVTQQVGRQIEEGLARYPGRRVPALEDGDLVRRFDLVSRRAGLALSARCWMLRRRSRIVLLQCKGDPEQGYRKARHPFETLSFGRPDLSIAVDLSGSPCPAPLPPRFSWISARSIEEAAAEALDEILAALASRTRERLGLDQQ